MATKDQLLTALRDSLDERGRGWLDEAIGRAAHGSLDELLTVYTMASRRMGKGPLFAPGATAGDTSIAHWTREDAARALLLLARSTGSGSTFAADACACYDMGDAREQESWLRALAMLPHPEQFLAYAVNACRSSISPVFEAIACENEYPSLYFAELNFNQMVLKALFSGVALARIVGLAGRLNAELTRMAADYASERRAAGRSVPADIGLAMQHTQEQSR